jgi:hypothetical protein
MGRTLDYLRSLRKIAVPPNPDEIRTKKEAEDIAESIKDKAERRVTISIMKAIADIMPPVGALYFGPVPEHLKGTWKRVAEGLLTLIHDENQDVVNKKIPVEVWKRVK